MSAQSKTDNPNLIAIILSPSQINWVVSEHIENSDPQLLLKLAKKIIRELDEIGESEKLTEAKAYLDKKVKAGANRDKKAERVKPAKTYMSRDVIETEPCEDFPARSRRAAKVDDEPTRPNITLVPNKNKRSK